MEKERRVSMAEGGFKLRSIMSKDTIRFTSYQGRINALAYRACARRALDQRGAQPKCPLRSLSQKIAE